MTARQRFLETLAARVPSLGRPVLVGVDGVDGAGKTVLADDLAIVLRRDGRSVERASVDGFHHPQAHRHAMGRTGDTVWSRSFDYRAMTSQLLHPWRAGVGSRYRTAIRDVESDRSLDDPPRRVPVGGTLVVDGIFLQREELVGAWDLVIFLDVPFETSVRRMAERDGSPDDEDDPRVARYVAAQRIYLATCRPRESADILVDHRDVQQPRLL